MIQAAPFASIRSTVSLHDKLLTTLVLLAFIAVLTSRIQVPQACAADRDVPSPVSPVRVSPRIIRGEPLSTRQSPIVEILRKDEDSTSLCTGSMLSPKTVLTAWHCVAPRARAMRVVLGERQVAVKRIAIHPLLREDPDTGLIYNDIAILHLNRPIRTVNLSLLLSRSVKVEDQLTIVGYGLDEYGSTGTLRQGWTDVNMVNAEHIITYFTLPKSNSCNGDSGGPAILAYRDKDGEVRSGIVGITSSGTSPFCYFGDETFYINVQSEEASDFIRSEVPTVSIR